jgi:hypothetical protein
MAIWLITGSPAARHRHQSPGGTVSECPPEPVFDNFHQAGTRRTILKALFPVPKPTANKGRHKLGEQERLHLVQVRPLHAAHISLSPSNDEKTITFSSSRAIRTRRSCCCCRHSWLPAGMHSLVLVSSARVACGHGQRRLAFIMLRPRYGHGPGQVVCVIRCCAHHPSILTRSIHICLDSPVCARSQVSQTRSQSV